MNYQMGENALLEQNDNQYHIFDTVNDGVSIYGYYFCASENQSKLHLRYANDALKTVLERPIYLISKGKSEEIAELSDILNRADCEVTSDHANQEYMILSSGKYFSVSISKLQDQGILMILHDITETVKTNKTLGMYKSFLENVKDIVFIIASDGRIIDANKEAVKVYGYTYDELTNMFIFELRNPDKIDFVRKQFEKAKFEGAQFETLHYKKNKEAFPVEVTSTNVSDGKERFLISVVRDITDRKKRTLEIKKLASIVESSDDAILGITLDGFITSWNRGAEKLYGYSSSEVVGKHTSILIPEGKVNNIEEVIRKIKNKEKFGHYETIRKRKDGQIIRITVSVSPIYDLDGNLQGVSATARDISEKYNMTKKLIDYEEKWKLINELTVANTFQSSLMSTSEHFDSADMYGKYLPCSLVGGDLYDCIKVGESIWFIIADVTGHGVVAAMVSTMVKGLFYNSIHSFLYPNDVLENINNIFYNMLGEYHEYMVSAFVGVIRDNDLYYSNAGHPYPLIINPVTQKSKALKQNGYLLAMMKDVEYERQHEKVGKDDMILLYSDGLFDLKDGNSTAYWDRISEFSALDFNTIKESPEDYIDHLINHFQNKGKDYEDDISIMLIRKK